MFFFLLSLNSIVIFVFRFLILPVHKTRLVAVIATARLGIFIANILTNNSQLAGG
jgi:hypothetical protein